jgi:hypothetical protein
MSNWADRDRVKKGDLGESIIIDYLHEKGFVIYKPITNKPHWIDFFASRNKDEIYAIDVKTKSRLNKWDATGIDIKHYNDYIKLNEKTGIRLFLFFVDDKEGFIHCADIQNLKNGFNPAPHIIAWYRKDMKLIGRIDKQYLKKLEKYDTRNYIYKPN